jgi:DNA-binding GntR family transcriptional regulator
LHDEEAPLTAKANLEMLAPISRVLGDHVADQLREAIVTDKLKPGQRIVEREIAEIMQTSRGPVRDALLLLENEGLVVRYPHRGTFVAELSFEDAEEIYSLRLSIELLAVKYVVEKATSADLDELDGLVEEMAFKVKAGYSISEATELDMAFHRGLCRISGHARALAAWEALSSQTRLLLLSRIRRKPRDFQEKAVVWHRRLADALRERDLELSQDELRLHMMSTLEAIAGSDDDGGEQE